MSVSWLEKGSFWCENHLQDTTKMHWISPSPCSYIDLYFVFIFGHSKIFCWRWVSFFDLTLHTFFKGWLFPSKEHCFIISWCPDENPVRLFHVLWPHLQEILNLLKLINKATINTGFILHPVSLSGEKLNLLYQHSNNTYCTTIRAKYFTGL